MATVGYIGFCLFCCFILFWDCLNLDWVKSKLDQWKSRKIK